jgi:hypothetical protein
LPNICRSCGPVESDSGHERFAALFTRRLLRPLTYLGPDERGEVHLTTGKTVSAGLTARRLPALLNNARSAIIASGPHATIWTHADQVNQALLDFIGHPGQAGRQHGGPENPPQSRSQNGRAG